jgi:membrane-associated phospholipid phosphatase
MKFYAYWILVFLAFLFPLANTLIAQVQPLNPTQTADPVPTPTPYRETRFFKNIAHDQLSIWTAPFKPHNYDAKWLIPLGLGTAALIATDRYTSEWVGKRGGLPLVSHDVSWAGKAYVTGGIAAAFYLTGRATHNERARETGILAAEALIDTGIVTHVLKFATQRPRPNSDNGSGEFFDGGNSFPSGHASTVWALATVVSYEYKNNPWIRYGSFGVAAAISASRYSGRNHFLSDIVVGSALGFAIGRFVYKDHHVPLNNTVTTPKPVTRWIPTIIPFYDRRTAMFGARAVWHI